MMYFLTVKPADLKLTKKQYTSAYANYRLGVFEISDINIPVPNRPPVHNELPKPRPRVFSRTIIPKMIEMTEQKHIKKNRQKNMKLNKMK